MNDKSNNSNGNDTDKLIKLSEAKEMMEQIISPVPTRPTLISYVKKGVLNGKKIFNTFYVYESSLREFMEKHK